LTEHNDRRQSPAGGGAFPRRARLTGRV